MRVRALAALAASDERAELEALTVAAHGA